MTKATEEAGDMAESRHDLLDDALFSLEVYDYALDVYYRVREAC